MTVKHSAGILLYRDEPTRQILLGRMGGPFWKNRTSNNWSIPKGEHLTGEVPEDAARREFSEELGLPVPAGELIDLGSVTQRGGKQVRIWALAADLDLSPVVLGTFELEWPPRSGRLQQFPELAEVAWLGVERCEQLLIAAQLEFIQRLQEIRPVR